MQNEGMPQAARTLAEIAHLLATADDADARIREVLKLVQQVVPNQCCALLEVVPINGRCELFSVPELLPDEGATLRKRLTALLRLMNDDDQGDAAATTPAHGTPTTAPGERPHLAVPVVGLNQVTGVLFVEHADSPYDEHRLRLLSVVAAQLGSYLTTLRLRQEELEHARQLGIALHRLQETDKRKDEFLALLGHELRNPLGAINYALRIIDHPSAGDVARYHAVIDRQIKHLSRIVDDLLDASRVRLGKIRLERQLVDLKLVAERWLEAYGPTRLAQLHDITLSGAEPVIVDGDPVRIDQVFANLLNNALKYTPSGGKIVVSIEQENNQGIIRVSDSGIGMTPAVLATIFELFAQADDALVRSDGGLGLGLPLVRSLVEKHGGTVEASSEGLGKGSEFIVRLPLASVAPSRGGPPPAVGVTQTSTLLRILIIEDNVDLSETVREMLSIWGHQVQCAGDGLQGLTKALTGSFDVLLVDIGLPTLDGYEVARRVRHELGQRTPLLLAMTGYGQPEDRRRAADAGFDAHLVKPLNAFELQARLAKASMRRS